MVFIREACGHFRRPRKKKLQHSESCAATKQTQALYWRRLPDSVQMWFETRRFVYFVKLKHASRTFFNLKLQRTAFHSKNAPQKCSQSSPRGPKMSPKCLRELPGDVLRGHTHLQSGPGASPIRQSGQSVVNSSKVEDPRDALGDDLGHPAPSSPIQPHFCTFCGNLAQERSKN